MSFDYKKVLKFLGFGKKEEKKPETFGESMISWIKTIVGAFFVVMIINGIAIASFVVPTGSMERTVMTGDFLIVNKFLYGPTTPQIIPLLNIPLPFYKFPGFKDPEQGDVIVFIYPGDRDELQPREFVYYLKRCVAKAGDSLQVIDKKVFVNGKEFKLPVNGQYDLTRPIYPGERQRTFPSGRGFTRDNWGPIRIPKKDDIININPANLIEWDTFIRREGHDVSSDGNSVYIDGKVAKTYKIERDYCFGMGDNRDNSDDSRYWGFIPYHNVVGTPMFVYWSWDTNLPFANLGEKLKTIRFSRIGKLIH